MQQWTPYSHIISGRTRCRREYHTIGVRIAIMMVVYPYLHVDHPWPRSTRDNNIVEREKFFSFTILLKNRMQECSPIRPHRVIAFKIVVEL